MITKTWSRQVSPCDSLQTFMHHHWLGSHDDPRGEDTPQAWLDDDALCQGDDPNPLLAAPGPRRVSTLLAGEIRDGRGHHPSAVFCDCAMTKARWEVA